MDMRFRQTLTALVACLVLGLGGSDARARGASELPLVGHWEFDLARFAQSDLFKDLDGEAKEMALDAAKAAFASFAVDVTKDTLELVTAESMTTVRYTVKSRSGSTYVLRLEPLEGSEGKVEEATFEVDGDAMRMEVPEVGHVPFKRAAAKPAARGAESAPTAAVTAGNQIPSEAKAIVGIWAFDAEAFMKTEQYRALAVEAGPEADAVIKQVLAKMSAEFTADGRLALVTPDGREETQFKVKRVEGNRYAIQTMNDDGSTAENIDIELDGTRMKMTNGPETLYFIRKS